MATNTKYIRPTSHRGSIMPRIKFFFLDTTVVVDIIFELQEDEDFIRDAQFS